MSDDLLTVTLTTRQARALHSAASMFWQMVAEMNPEFESHVEAETGKPPTLTSGLLALEACLMLAVES